MSPHGPCTKCLCQCPVRSVLRWVVPRSHLEMRSGLSTSQVLLEHSSRNAALLPHKRQCPWHTTWTDRKGKRLTADFRSRSRSLRIDRAPKACSSSIVGWEITKSSWLPSSMISFDNNLLRLEPAGFGSATAKGQSNKRYFNSSPSLMSMRIKPAFVLLRSKSQQRQDVSTRRRVSYRSAVRPATIDSCALRASDIQLRRQTGQPQGFVALKEPAF